MFFWQDLGKLAWKFLKAIIIFAGIFFFLLIGYFRPDMYVKNIFQDLRNLKLARASFEEKNQKIINEIKELKKQKEILEKQDDILKWRVNNLEKRIEIEELRTEELKKEEKQKEEEEENSTSPK
ncbi:hypothetical protein KJ586_02395 [Patescibacteria group bacterium]|nr:hypothetical protein [Patescibacteria group bacterium]MBU4347458.1 hypothetical protein [Patescibacteria group bacterium]MBU4455338.1 hypothetical protein [Patescibacteria group bacterium]MCG2690603.1 hypothetical protein [Candidatus Parcubacteria bacterium]